MPLCDVAIEKAAVLMEALPYLRAFHGKTIVIKAGGSLLDDPRLTLASNIAWLKLAGLKPVLVHGGGPAITRAATSAGLDCAFDAQGRRVTTPELMTLARRVLCDEMNPHWVSALLEAGVAAKGLHCLFHARPLAPQLGHTGQINGLHESQLQVALDNDQVPVIAPIGQDAEGGIYNLDADEAARWVAMALGAEKLVYLSNVPGVLLDASEPQSLCSRLSITEAKQLLAKPGTITGGMRPKIQNAIAALAEGVRTVHLLDGRRPHALLLEIFTHDGVGTMFIKEETGKPAPISSIATKQRRRLPA